MRVCCCPKNMLNDVAEWPRSNSGVVLGWYVVERSRGSNESRWAFRRLIMSMVALSRDEDRRRLLAVVKALPEQDRRCLALRAEGLRYRQIAEVLGMSLGGVANSLERSLERITRAAQQSRGQDSKK